MRYERDYFPEVVASPIQRPVNIAPWRDEESDIDPSFDRLYYNGQVEQKRRKRLFPYQINKIKSWRKKHSILHKRRNQNDLQILRQAGLV